MLAHPDPQFVYFAPEPTEYGIIYEVKRELLVEVLETGRVQEKLSSRYSIVRIYLHPSSVIVKMQWMLAAELPSDARTMHESVATLCQQKSSAPIADILRERLWEAGAAGAQLQSPTPSPSLSPSPSPTPGGGGSGVSGVRG